jgi:hypothetical protein
LQVQVVTILFCANTFLHNQHQTNKQAKLGALLNKAKAPRKYQENLWTKIYTLKYFKRESSEYKNTQIIFATIIEHSCKVMYFKLQMIFVQRI